MNRPILRYPDGYKAVLELVRPILNRLVSWSEPEIDPSVAQNVRRSVLGLLHLNLIHVGLARE